MSKDVSHPTPALFPFHLAFPVQDLKASRHFYVHILGCDEGRSSNEWIDFNLYGHQIVAHQVTHHDELRQACSLVDGHQVPVRHFGVVLPYQEWHELSENLKAKQVRFLEPTRVLLPPPWMLARIQARQAGSVEFVVREPSVVRPIESQTDRI